MQTNWILLSLLMCSEVLTNIFALYLQFKFDYLTATYFLLLEKKMKGRPVRLLNKIRNHDGTCRVVIFHYLSVYLSFMMSAVWEFPQAPDIIYFSHNKKIYPYLIIYMYIHREYNQYNISDYEKNIYRQVPVRVSYCFRLGKCEEMKWSLQKKQMARWNYKLKGNVEFSHLHVLYMC